MLKKVEYSQIVRYKLRALMKKLAECFGTKIAKKTVDNILRKLESLQDFEEMGIIKKK